MFNKRNISSKSIKCSTNNTCSSCPHKKQINNGSFSISNTMIDTAINEYIITEEHCFNDGNNNGTGPTGSIGSTGPTGLNGINGETGPTGLQDTQVIQDTLGTRVSLG